MKIVPVRAELFHADRQTDKKTYDETDSRYSHFSESAKKSRIIYINSKR